MSTKTDFSFDEIFPYFVKNKFVSYIAYLT